MIDLTPTKVLWRWISPLLIISYGFAYTPLVFTSTMFFELFLQSFKTAFGASPEFHLEQAPLMAAYTIAFQLISTFLHYWHHRSMHSISVLWKIHKCHHSADVLTPITVTRNHPISGFLNQTRNGLCFGLTTAIFVYLFDQEMKLYKVVGGIGIFTLLHSTLGLSYLRHSRLWISFGPAVERFILGPPQHQVHHSKDPMHYS